MAFALRDGLDALGAAGTHPSGLVAVGGGARSDTWLGMLATIFDMPIDRPASGEHGAVFGAARLAIIAAENAEAHAVCALPEIGSTIAPDARRKTAYVRAHARFRDAYQALRPLFAQPASILK